MDYIKRISTTETSKFEGELVGIVAEIVLGFDQYAVDSIVKELVETKNKNAQSNYVKVLYEVGREAPGLIEPHSYVFLKLLSNKNNRLVWGAMYSLASIANANPKVVNDNLSHIIEAMDGGSRITIDGGIKILSKLSANKKYSDYAFPVLLDKLATCDIKKFPAYIEEAQICKDVDMKKELVNIIERRMHQLEKATQLKRVGKVLKIMKGC